MAAATLIIGTLDTKLDEILYLREQIHRNGGSATLILDVSHTSNNTKRYREWSGEITAPCLEHSTELSSLARGEYVDKAIELCLGPVKDMVEKGQIHGIVSAGGSTGSSLACAIMRRACPVGFPKLMVSTMACKYPISSIHRQNEADERPSIAGDIQPYIEECDITMMYSVVDIAGLNSILQRILQNAAAAIAAMTNAYAQSITASSPGASATRRRIGLSMFGVTTPAADHIRKILTSPPHLDEHFEVYVFHATGAGGRAMERLVEEGQLDAVIDLTTTECADELFGGVLTAGPDRLEAAARKGIPNIVSVGGKYYWRPPRTLLTHTACDMINFGPKDSVPEKHLSRNLYVHNPTVTLMRTSKENNWQIGKFIASQLKTHSQDQSKTRVLLPMKGVSMIDAPGQPFHDPEADAELFNAITQELDGTNIIVEKVPDHINDEKFAEHICSALLDMLEVDPRAYRLANARRRKWSFDHGATVNIIRRSSALEIPTVAEGDH